MKEPYQNARKTFDSGSLVSNAVTLLQYRLNTWQNQELKSTPNGSYLGVTEEIGELAGALLEMVAAAGKLHHARLKTDQGIKNYGDIERLREEAADAIADITISCMQLATNLRLDFWTLLLQTAEKVMERRFASTESNS